MSSDLSGDSGVADRAVGMLITPMLVRRECRVTLLGDSVPALDS